MNLLKNLILGTAVLTVGASVAFPVNVLATSSKSHDETSSRDHKNHEKHSSDAADKKSSRGDESKHKEHKSDKDTHDKKDKKQHESKCDDKETKNHHDNKHETPVAKPVTPREKPVTPTAPQVEGDSTTSSSGTLLPEAASTVKAEVKGATAPETIAATGANPLQILFNTLFAGLGVYTALLRRK